MRIEAINEQLLRAIGAGVAILDADDLRLRFFNEVTFDQGLSGAPASDRHIGLSGAFGHEPTKGLKRIAIQFHFFRFFATEVIRGNGKKLDMIGFAHQIHGFVYGQKLQ